jgi:hypothetical protein
MSGTTGANLPVTITVTGAQQAEQAIARVGQAGAAAATSIRGSMNNATQGVASFIVQVASGTTSLGGLAQSASGLLPLLGPAGMFAAGAVAVGALAAQLLSTSRATEQLRQAQEALSRNMEISNRFFETQQEAADRLEQSNRANATSATAAAIAIQAQAQAVRALRLAELEATMEQVRLARELGGENTGLPAAVQRRVAEFERLRAELSDGATALAQLDQRMNDLRSGRPSGRQVDQAARDAERANRGGRGGTRAQFVDPQDAAMGANRDFDEAHRESVQAMQQFERQQALINAGIENAGPIFAAHERQLAVFNRALGTGVINEEQFAAAVGQSTERLNQQITELKQRSEGVNNIGRDIGKAFGNAFEDAIIKGRRFGDVLKSLANDLASLILRQSITQPLANAFSSALGNIDFGSMFSGIFRADGGPVTGGKPYIVGERGPEWFVPGQSGTVLPNGMSPGGDGGVTINQSFSVDARGADQGVIPRLRQEMVAIARAANSELLDAIQRGGSTARIVGRRA